MLNTEWNDDSYQQKNGLLRQEYSRRLKEQMEEKRIPATARKTLPPVPIAYEVREDVTAEEEGSEREIETKPPSPFAPILQKLSSVSLSSGDWLILGLLFYFLFMTDDTDYILVGILAYILLSD